MKRYLLILCCVFLTTPGFTQGEETDTSGGYPTEEMMQLLNYFDSIEKSMVYDSGIIELPGIAKIHLPSGYKYLNKEQAHFVLTEIWGNPKDQTTMGIILPSDAGVTSGDSWVFNINYEAMGYVEDKDAEDVDYTEMMKTMKEESAEDSKARIAEGYEGYTLVGWAEQPFYDKESHTIYWAKELDFDSEEENTVNYDFRILGRKGVLSLNAIAGMNQLEEISALKKEVTGMVKFEEGQAYADFDSDIDEVAAYTVGGLVAGKILAKAGLWVFLAKFSKLIIPGAIALGAGIVAFFRGRKKNEEESTPELTQGTEDKKEGEE